MSEEQSHSPISSCFAGRMKRFSAEDEHVTKKPTKTQSRSSPILLPSNTMVVRRRCAGV